ncbi:glycoside hydrolase family 88 protein [Flavobacteriaceae bacterium F89]|uniref:Glycoside hydrolase family 88 protein n=1 Tax=Cerina litoralis TaxID=2874477 RepID=A0AAE3JPW6_9FLAO|nr:glycoside hydrolase family 88 protein [Cerina litoralis]MCG2461219.1 glycoside hydrolase family 88 protein [Cerina litoralis]
MKVKPTLLLIILALMIGCSESPKKPVPTKSILDIAQSQYDTLYKNALPYIDTKTCMPRTIQDGKLHLVDIYDWTSGFYPGSLWYLYGLTKDDKWKSRAIAYTEKLDTIQYWEGNHDVGFMIECSYGNALKYANSKAYDSIIVRTAQSLSTRFHPKAGIIQSWEANKRWKCPVIIDNMMNLELLFHATKISGDSTYYDIAVTHANTTMKNHFRKDFSSYHVVDYDPETGEVLQKNTHQGYSDDSAWARGQSWGLYGYTVCYRETKDPKYLEQAIHIANFIKTNPNLPDDQVPYWDYDVPKDKDTPRDASAASILASALYELSTYMDQKEGKEYVDWADKIIASLKSPEYLAEAGSNEGFLLKHSIGSKPHEVEIDVPLNYADYYFLEALYRNGRFEAKQ